MTTWKNVFFQRCSKVWKKQSVPIYAWGISTYAAGEPSENGSTSLEEEGEPVEDEPAGLHTEEAMHDEIRIIRNAVMHFDPDGLTPEQVDVLKRFGAFLRTLR